MPRLPRLLDEGPPHGRWLKQNEDVSLAVLAHRAVEAEEAAAEAARAAEGGGGPGGGGASSSPPKRRLEANAGDFPWSGTSERPAGDRDEGSLIER